MRPDPSLGSTHAAPLFHGLRPSSVSWGEQDGLTEQILLIENSRTMMLTWFFAGLCLHHVMTNPASKVIFWGPDEDRALQPLDYAWTLWENQDQQLKEAWPLDRPRERQAYMKMELANDSVLVALPGKDPDRIRKDHPTIVFFDETAIIERFEESYGVALAARPVKIVASRARSRESSGT